MNSLRFDDEGNSNSRPCLHKQIGTRTGQSQRVSTTKGRATPPGFQHQGLLLGIESCTRQSRKGATMRKLAAYLCVLVSLNAFAAKHRKNVPPAPLPTVVVTAKKIFLSNGGGSNLAYDSFYSEMKQWGKYEIVGSPEEADLIVELAYRVERGGTRVWSSSNTYDGTTQVHSAQIVDPQLTLTIFDAKTKNSLWSELDHRRLARRENNREKEIINSADRLVEDLKARVSIPR